MATTDMLLLSAEQHTSLRERLAHLLDHLENQRDRKWRLVQNGRQLNRRSMQRLESAVIAAAEALDVIGAPCEAHTEPATTPEPMTVAELAAEMLLVWRYDARLSDADIVRVCLVPDEHADDCFEIDQVIRTGRVYAPAKLVKARMLELIADEWIAAGRA